MTARIELGDKVKDTMTGIEGIAYGRSIYMTGCDHIGIKRTGTDPDGKPHDLHWVDEPLVKVTKANAYKLPDESARGAPAGGPSLHRHSK
jgi:hypothetical protein